MPRLTEYLLEKFVTAGFDDDAFQVIHPEGANATIPKHLKHCKKTVGAFPPGEQNELVRKRLELIDKVFFNSGFSSPAKKGVFEFLARAVASELPQ